jgi:hypothetical protein
LACRWLPPVLSSWQYRRRDHSAALQMVIPGGCQSSSIEISTPSGRGATLRYKRTALSASLGCISAIIALNSAAFARKAFGFGPTGRCRGRAPSD